MAAAQKRLQTHYDGTGHKLSLAFAFIRTGAEFVPNHNPSITIVEVNGVVQDARLASLLRTEKSYLLRQRDGREAKPLFDT